MGIFSKATKVFSPLLKPALKAIGGSGKGQAKRAQRDLEVERQASAQERLAIADERKKELMKANKIKIRALRSKRGSAYFEEGGRETIG